MHYLHALAKNKLQASCTLVVYNHWTGMVDWNGGMEWWNRKFSKIEVKRSHFLMHEDINSDLMASLAYTEVK